MMDLETPFLFSTLELLNQFESIVLDHSVLFMIDNQVIVSDSTTVQSHAIVFDKNMYISSPDPWSSLSALDCTLYGLKVQHQIQQYRIIIYVIIQIDLQSKQDDSNACKLTQTDNMHSHAAVWMDKNDAISSYWTDYTLITQFTIYNNVNSSGNPDACPLFRVFGELNQNLGFKKGSTTVYWFFSALTPGVTHKLTIIASGCNFDVYLDDRYKFRRTDCTYTYGTVGWVHSKHE